MAANDNPWGSTMDEGDSPWGGEWHRRIPSHCTLSGLASTDIICALRCTFALPTCRGSTAAIRATGDSARPHTCCSNGTRAIITTATSRTHFSRRRQTCAIQDQNDTTSWQPHTIHYPRKSR
jgi:hypothetical protein